MLVAIRGVPDFSFVETKEYKDISELFNEFDLSIRNGVFRLEYSFRNRDNKKVMLCIENSEENKSVISEFCKNKQERYFYIKFKEGRLTSSGTIPSDWIMLEGTNHPSAKDKLAEFKQQQEKERKFREQQEKEEQELEDELSDLVDSVGLENCVSILRKSFKS